VIEAVNNRPRDWRIATLGRLCELVRRHESVVLEKKELVVSRQWEFTQSKILLVIGARHQVRSHHQNQVGHCRPIRADRLGRTVTTVTARLM
jgi:hypothetical protein